MTPQPDDDLWRNRFITMNLARIGGAAVALLGCAIWQTNLLAPNGSILGLPVALAGVMASFLAPKWLSGYWKRQDGR
jgi:hypothetical protein